MADQIADIERRRYIELAKQQAALGIETPPHIMLELADMRAKHGPIELLNRAHALPPERRRKLDLDVDFLIAQVASVMKRQMTIEAARRRQEWMDWIQFSLLLVLLVVVVVMGYDLWH